jgi:hypothetical protein
MMCKAQFKNINEFTMLNSVQNSRSIGLGLIEALFITGMIVPIAQAQENNPKPVKVPAIKPTIIKYELDILGKNDEWVRLEVTGDVVKLLHTRVGESEASSAINSVASLVPLPVTPPTFYRWYDHKTTRVAFQPDNCPKRAISVMPSTCLITGIDTLTLPSGRNIRQGLITIEYEDRKLIRSVTFRLPKK